MLDAQFASAIAPIAQFLGNIEKPKIHDIETRRRLLASLVPPGQPVIPDEIQHSTVRIPTPDGAEIRVLRYRKKEAGASTGPAVIHMHGGGLISMSADMSIPSICQYVMASGVQFFSVDYRLAPENTYPIPLEDCWAALQWVIANSIELGVDVARIGVMGDSAGGGLAAAVAILARDRALNPPLKRQILLYPMLDDRTAVETAPDVFSIWSLEDNITAWTAYLGKKTGGSDVPATAAPGRLQDVNGLPPLYMDIGQLDIFAQENLTYVGKFLAASIETEFHLYPGLPHGFDGLVREHFVTLALEENRVRQLKKLYD
ncbi:FAD binding domain-containingprotein [Purpureocillium lavendulum]|uniref:FAD binding domain-containingprotein n=1 Tax=Purpureocillium lavendulum TaxID=1247861 RepID=A0AB34FGG0_9HYPO|nr:FAD binding domain-containingprotein [Purpureocillium lavendulum]